MFGRCSGCESNLQPMESIIDRPLSRPQPYWYQAREQLLYRHQLKWFRVGPIPPQDVCESDRHFVHPSYLQHLQNRSTRRSSVLAWDSLQIVLYEPSYRRPPWPCQVRAIRSTRSEIQDLKVPRSRSRQPPVAQAWRTPSA